MINVRPLKVYRGVEAQRLSLFTSALDVVDQREASAGIYHILSNLIRTLFTVSEG
jgi:hypothetical protein